MLFTSDTYINPAETGLYYLGSRYYSPELCRFISADGQINHGMKGCNIYIYCNNNPINKYDPSGKACICLTQRVFGNHVCDSQKNPVSEALGMFSTAANGGYVFGITATEYSYRSAVRPNNIGKGTWNKTIDTMLNDLGSFSNSMGTFLDALDYITVGVETVENISFNTANNESMPKIIWDAVVDVGVLGGSVFVSGKAGTIATGIVTGTLGFGLGPGLIVGLLVGGFVEYILDGETDGIRENIKSWIN